MTKEELAEQFANEQAAEITEKLKAAYLKGYEQGELKSASTIKIDGVTYIDLDLPSGTLWSEKVLTNNGCCRRLGYHEAQKLNIPTKEQVDELSKYSRLVFDDYGYYIVGPNSQRLWYNFSNVGEGLSTDRPNHCLWIKGEADENNNAPVQVIYNGPGYHFTGYKLPVFLVKNKAEL